jgi:hypothetical protein
VAAWTALHSGGLPWMYLAMGATVWLVTGRILPRWVAVGLARGAT